MANNLDYSNIWELYGLKADPFTTDALVVYGGILPIECFIGRKNELQRLNKQFRSGSSRVLVIGDVGVGKTSFVNFSRSLAIKGGYFSHLKEIGVMGDWHTNEFIINTLQAIYSALTLESKESLISEDSFKKLKSIVDFYNYEKGLRGISVAGFGLEYGSERFSPPIMIPTNSLMELATKIVKEIHNKTGKDVILHYNNLENLKEMDIRRLFEDLRDFFQMPHTHFVFVGNLITNGIIQGSQRVSSIFSDSIMINEMTFEEIEEVINKRLELLKIENLNLVKPFDKSALDKLYNLYGGNIRNILNSLKEAILASVINNPIILTDEDIARTLRQLVEERHFKILVEKERQILRYMANKEEITNKSLATGTNTAQSNVSKYLKHLQNLGYVEVKRKSGKDKFWTVAPKIKWVLLKEPKQKHIVKYMPPKI